jgi:ribonucleoside-diphosphate reductase alpha chain
MVAEYNLSGRAVTRLIHPCPMSEDAFETSISRHIWDTKYRYREGDTVRDADVGETWRRVAKALARVEKGERKAWEAAFFDVLRDFRFLPGGRILAGAGTGRRVTLFNCFVMGTVEDSMDGIFDALKEGALTMQQGGGVGYDFSTLRPSGTQAKSVGGIASGPVSFMRIWDSMCATLLSTGARRGAMMATLRCDHPDIEHFVTVKQDPRELRHFNLSVLVSDAFMAAVEQDADWPLVFPDAQLLEGGPPGEGVVERDWSGAGGPIPCRVLRVVRARGLWDRIMRATYDYAEPGVLFIDRINQQNNLSYRERIAATNPCGEIPLPAYGACNLGSVNLTRFVREPFTAGARLDLDGIREAVGVAVRLMDNVIDASRFPVRAQAEQARGSRRIGLGFTGLADALIMLGVRYGEEDSYRLAGELMRAIRDTAYRTSVGLARDKGAFPFFDREAYLDAPFVRDLPGDIREGIARDGIRNSHLTAVAPTGTISLLANNVSSGIEPVFEYHYRRRVLEVDGTYAEHELSDHAWRQWRSTQGEQPLPPAFIRTRSLPPLVHLHMQAAVQPCVDNAISKTINVPVDLPFSDFKSIYQEAYRLGLKGCTTFRPNPVTGAVLSAPAAAQSASHCCDIEREAD